MKGEGDFGREGGVCFEDNPVFVEGAKTPVSKQGCYLGEFSRCGDPNQGQVGHGLHLSILRG